jgi:hypothetical protein
MMFINGKERLAEEGTVTTGESGDELARVLFVKQGRPSGDANLTH